MPHVALVPFTGLRVAEPEMLAFGMSLPGFRERAGAISELPSLGLLTLAGMLPEHWSCSYHPSARSDDLVRDVLDTSPDLVAVSALTASVDEAYSFAREIRRNGVPVVLGGLHATALPDEALKHVDAVCVGDGESSWPGILSDIEADELQPIYKSAKPFSLQNATKPRFDLVPMGQVARWTVQTQRGCPWACEFCGASRLLGPPRYKPPALIDQELDAIKQLDASPWIELADDNTLAGRADAELLLETLESQSIRYFTENDYRIGEDPELLKRLAKSGCVQVLIGIESLAFGYHGMGKKESQLTRIMAAIDAIQDAGIVVNGCFILGADGETPSSIDHLIDFARNSSLAEIQLTLQTPFPGTGLYRRLQSQGRLLSKPWSHFNLFDVVYQPDQLTVSDLEAGFRRALQGIFSEDVAQARKKRRLAIWRNHPSFSNQKKQ
ncbi:B12-binding domain-containing radical SAM protein [Pirellulaceae bacterium SH449]